VINSALRITVRECRENSFDFPIANVKFERRDLISGVVRVGHVYLFDLAANSGVQIPVPTRTHAHGQAYIYAC